MTSIIASLARPAVRLGLLLAGVLAAGCVTQSVKKVNSVEAARAERDLPAAELLDVSIVAFDPGVPETLKEQQDENIYPAVRQAEANYMPYVLRRALQNTAYWGTVRVLPEANPGSDVTITGKILESDGETLKLRVRATDATGRQWFDRTYEDTAAEFAYTEKLPPELDPFQDLYNRIANDLLAERRQLSRRELREVQQVADLRFAADLAPQRFDQYLKQDRDGRYRVRRLPPEDDPFLARVDAIRARDDMLVDTLDQHYEGFQHAMEPKYLEYRKSSYQEAAALRELRRSEIWRKVVGGLLVAGGAVALAKSGNAPNAGTAGIAGIAGGAYLFKTGMDKSREKQVHIESLRELNASLETDVKPQVVELEGRTVTLTGSAKEQYRQWRQLLREMYVAETGSSDRSLPDGAGSAQHPQ